MYIYIYTYYQDWKYHDSYNLKRYTFGHFPSEPSAPIFEARLQPRDMKYLLGDDGEACETRKLDVSGTFPGHPQETSTVETPLRNVDVIILRSDNLDGLIFPTFARS